MMLHMSGWFNGKVDDYELCNPDQCFFFALTEHPGFVSWHVHTNSAIRPGSAASRMWNSFTEKPHYELRGLSRLPLHTAVA